MRLVAYDPFVSADRARQMGVELLSLDQAVAEADFLTIHLPKTKETTGLINRDLLLEGQADAARHQRRPRRHRRRGGPRRGDPRRRDRRRRARRVRHRADHRVAAVRARRRSSSPRTSAPSTARRRTRPATRSPTWSSWPWPASSCRSPSTSTPPRPTRRCVRSCRSPSGSAGCSPRSSARRPSTLEVCTEGDIAGYDTRILTLGRARRASSARVTRRAGHLRQRAAARQGPRRRGARDQLRDVGRLRQPHHAPRRRPLAVGHARRPRAASSAS